MTMKEWAERWMEADVRPKVRPTTYEAKRYVLQNHILTKLGDIPLSDLTEAQICRFLDERKRFGSHRPESVEYPGLSEVTMRHIHRCLQECLDSAVSTGMIPVNPARAFHYPTQRKVKATVLGDTEIEEYLDAAQALGYLPIFTLMLTVGLRQRELLALKWSDLDEQTGVLTIRTSTFCTLWQMRALPTLPARSRRRLKTRLASSSECCSLACSPAWFTRSRCRKSIPLISRKRRSL